MATDKPLVLPHYSMLEVADEELWLLAFLLG
jgi:hypothetical protein